MRALFQLTRPTCQQSGAIAAGMIFIACRSNPTIDHRSSPRRNSSTTLHRCTLSPRSTTPVTMAMLIVTGPSQDAETLVNERTDYSQLLLQRLATWETLISNLLEFFTQIRRFRNQEAKNHAKLAKIIHQVTDIQEDIQFHSDGIICLWQAIHENQTKLSRFCNGINKTYKDIIIKDLRMQLVEIASFKTEICLQQGQKATIATRCQKKFMKSVADLNASINQLQPLTVHYDPFLKQRSTYLLHDSI
jgi:hypothetical protein